MSNSQRLPASRFQIVPFACTLLSAGLICAGSIEPFAQGLCEIMDPTGTPLNVRASPNGHIVGTLQNGVQVSVLDRVVDRKKQAWVYVGHSEDQSPIGWVYREFIACKSDGTASQGLVGSAHAVEKVHPAHADDPCPDPDAKCLMRDNPRYSDTPTIDGFPRCDSDEMLANVKTIPMHTPFGVPITIFTIKNPQGGNSRRK